MRLLVNVINGDGNSQGPSEGLVEPSYNFMQRHKLLVAHTCTCYASKGIKFITCHGEKKRWQVTTRVQLHAIV